MTFTIGTRVAWSRGHARCKGEILKRFGRTVSRTLRRGDADTQIAAIEKPAFLILSADGAIVLKSITEIEEV